MHPYLKWQQVANRSNQSQRATTWSSRPQERLLAVIAAVQEELQALGEGLQRRASVAAARSTLELMQDTAHAMSKVR